MIEDELEPAEAALFGAHPTSRTRILHATVFVGILCLVAGVTMFFVELSAEQLVWFESGSLKITAGSCGAATLLVSAICGYTASLFHAEVATR